MHDLAVETRRTFHGTEFPGHGEGEDEGGVVDGIDKMVGGHSFGGLY